MFALVRVALGEGDPSPIIQVNSMVLAFVAGSIVPLVVALLTKLNASSTVKAVVNVILSIIGGVVAYLLAHEGSGSVLQISTVAITTYLASGVTYTHLWKPTGAAKAVADTAPNLGLG